MVVLDRCASWQLTDVLTVIGVVVLCGVCLAAGVAGVVAADAGDEVGLTTDRILSTQYETDVSGDIVPDTGTVIGTVTAEDGEPIPDADIEVVEQIDDGNPDPVEGGFTATLTTDENGEFEVEVRSGVYRITAGALGYANGLNQNVEVGVGETVEDVDFQLSPVPVLSGSVTDAETGDPIEGAEIESRLHTSALYTATTNATGEYSINLPDDASSSVEFVADGYFSEFVEVDEADLDDLPDIHVALDPVPEETGFVVGQVTNQVGDPVQSAFVTAVDSPMPGVLTNQTGWYELEVETGSHTIEVLWEGPEFPRIVEGVEVTEGDTTRVDVGAVDSGDPELAVHEAVGLPEEVETGENVTIDTAIENVGEGDGTLLVPLEVNGDVVEAVAYELNASESATVSFDHSFDSRGEYEVFVGDFRVGNVTVRKSADVTIFGASVNRSELVVGEPAVITANLYNRGDVEGNLTIDLRVEGEHVVNQTVENDTVTVDPGISRDAVEFVWTPTEGELGGAETDNVTLKLNDRTVETLPLELRITDVQVIAAATDADQVVHNETFHVTGSIYQAGTIEGPQEIALNATHEDTGETVPLNTTEVSLPPGWYHLGALNLSGTFSERTTAGTYELTLGDREAGTIEVAESYSDIKVIAGSANATEVVQNETFHATGSIYQNGTIAGPETIALNATPREPEGTDPITLAWSDEVSLPPGWYHLGALNLSTTIDDDFTPGTYDLHLGDREIGTLEVIAAKSDIRVIAGSANATEVVQGQSFHATGSIYQNGTIAGPETIALNATPREPEGADPITLAWSDEVSLPPGWYHLGALNLSATVDDDFTPGTYDLHLGDREIGSLEVITAESDIQVISASPSEMNVTRSETFYVTGGIYQNGTIDGPQEIPLNATPYGTNDPITLNTTEATLKPGWYHLGGLNVSATFDDGMAVGRYNLTLGDYHVGTIGVEESPSDVQVIAASLSEIAVVEGEELYVTGSVYQNGTANGDDWSENVSLIGTPENGDGEPEVLGSDEVHVQPGWYALNAINISFSIPEPGTYTLTLGEHYAGTVEVLPAESDVRVIAGSANATEVVQGQSFHATGSIYQNGTIDGPQTIALNATLNGSDDPITLAWSDEVSLPPGWYHLGALNLSATVDDDFTPGTYDLHLGDREIGTLEVQAAKSDVQVIAGSANATEVVQGQSFYATGSIYQNGTIDGPEKIPLNATPREPEGADPVTLARSDEVSLPPGWYHLGGLNLSATVDGDFTPGTYDLHLGDREIGTLEVIAAESDIRVIAGSPNATEVVQGQSFYATGSIYQNGTIDGPQTIALNATLTGSDDPITLAWSDEVSLPPGWYHLGGLNLSATIGDDFTPGTYKLDLGDREIGTLEVLAAESDIQVIAGSADAEEVAYGEAFHVTGSIYQNGTIDGPQSIPLNATQVDTGETETLGWSDEVSLPPSWYHLGALNLSATFGPDAGGTYDLTLGEYYAGTITVSEPTVAVTAVDVRGAGTGVDPDLEYASDDVTVDVTVQSDLPIEDVHVFVESRETTFIEDVEATHVDDEVWSAEIPVEDLPDDGAYDVSALAIDEFDTPGDLKANRTLVIDTEAPSLSVSVEDISGVDATIVVESSEPLDGVPDVDATFEDDPGVDIDVTMDQASMGGTTYTGTIEFDESGNYTVTATGTDLAGNTGEDSTSAVIYTGISIADQAITIDATGTTIDFDVADHAVTSDELFLAFSESAVNANVDGGDVGVGFLTAELDDVLHDYMAGDEVAGATISMAIDETALPGDAVAEDVELQYFDEANDAWDPVTGSEVNRVGGDPFVTASVTHFSTYGAVLPDTAPPEITVVESPADGAVFDAETDSVDFEVTFEDPYSGIDASSVTIEVNGVDRSEDFAYTSSWLNDTLDVEDGTAYEVTLSVSDEAGNEATHAVSFEVASSSPESPESSDGGSGSSGDDGDSGSSGSSGSSDSSGSSSESSTPGADDDTSAEDDESPDSDADFSVPDDTPGTGDGDSTTDETGHDDGGDTPSESDIEPDVDEEDSVPGFGVIIAVFAALLVAIRLTRPR